MVQDDDLLLLGTFVRRSECGVHQGHAPEPSNWLRTRLAVQAGLGGSSHGGANDMSRLFWQARMRWRAVRRSISRGAIGCAAAIALFGCGNRAEQSAAAALSLSQHIAPEYAWHVRKTVWMPNNGNRYRVELGIEQDPYTRVSILVDHDPRDCSPGSECEERLRAAMALGFGRRAELADLDAAFTECGVHLHEVESIQGPVNSGSVFIRTIAELQLTTPSDPLLIGKLENCAAEFVGRRGENPWSQDPINLSLRLIDAGDEAPGRQGPLTLEDRLDASRRAEPMYMLAFDIENGTISPQPLRFMPLSELKRAIDDKASEAARNFIASEAGGYVPAVSIIHVTAVHPDDFAVFDGYVPACSSPPPASGLPPCQQDVAVRLTWNLRTQEATAMSLTYEVPRQLER